MTHGSLFSGIGGFDLAAEWMGWENIFHCEWNEFGKKVLHNYWPKAISYHDITKTDFTIHRGRIDILTGGFPCQPYSMAGKRKGKEDERHLWPEMLRAIKEIQPRWVVGENVYGLVNWSGGLVFHEVQADLEAAGYEVFPYVLPAASVNAPHRRDRIWFVAYAVSQRNTPCRKSTSIERNGCENNGQPKEWSEQTEWFNGLHGLSRYAPHPNSTRCENWDKQHRGQQTQNGEGQRCTCGYCIGINQSNAPRPNRNGLNGCDCQHEDQPGEGRDYAQRNFEQMGRDVADTGLLRLQQCENGGEMGGGQKEMGRQGSESTNAIETDGTISNAANTNGIELRGQSNRTGESGFIGKNEPPTYWQNFPTQSPVRFGDDGISTQLDGITFSKWRNESIKAAGNAIVPQVALQIFKTIQQYEALPRMADTL